MANILIVDDDESLREVLVDAVTNLGHQAIDACNGVEALDKFRESSFDIVLTDLKMPQMDGLRLLEEIKKLKYDAVVIMITAFPTVDSAVQAIKLGAYDYITKPFKIEELEVVLDRALEKKRLLRQLGLFRGMFWLAVFTIPFWIILGILWTFFSK